MHALLDFFQLQNDGENLQKELEQLYPSGSVPCYRTAPARRPGEISGKITWPSDKENPNFPALMVHESLQDKDFSLLKVGDPLFVAPDRSVVYYDGSHGTFISTTMLKLHEGMFKSDNLFYSAGDSVYVVFVNEAGYYYEASGTGIGVAVSSHYDLGTGLLKEMEQESLPNARQ